MSRLGAWLGFPQKKTPERYSLGETMSFGGHAYPLGYQTTYGAAKAEPISFEFLSFVDGALKSNGAVFALERQRLAVFSEARFQYRAFEGGRPGKLWGDSSLALLERPWAGGTTGDLLSRMLLDADLAGNAYVVNLDGELVRLRPDWVQIVLTDRLDDAGMVVGQKRLAYLYFEGGPGLTREYATFWPEQVAHFAPMPDPSSPYRGMSWLTPVIRQIQADILMTGHKVKFFENAAPQPLDAKILTPSGWSTMGEMSVGSEIVGADGKAHPVTGVFPQGEQDIYRVTFSDGAVAECTADHVWRVANAHDRRNDTYRILSLAQMVEGGLHYPNGAKSLKWAVPLPEPVQYAEANPLPLDPYLLGCLLGDGSFRGNGKGSGTVSYSTHLDDADEMQSSFALSVPAGVRISRRDRGNWSEFTFARELGGPRGNALTGIVRDLGLFDVIGHEKFIPAAYLTAGVMDRVAMLQGLIDSDGSVSLNQHGVRFTNTSRALCEQLVDLVGSLGGSASIRPVARSEGRQQWTVTVRRLPEWITPARLARKVSRYAPAARVTRWRHIASAELVDRREAQCIRVDSEDHLYITDDFVVTHNTPNLAVSMKEGLTPEQFNAFVDAMDAAHGGAENSGKTLYTANGADVTVIGANMKAQDHTNVQGATQTQLANAAGVPVTIVGFSEGLAGSSLNAGNYNAAKRNFADGTMRNLWRNVAGSLEVLFPPPNGSSQLWYDERDVAFLRDDAKDRAEIASLDAQQFRTLVDAGFTPESIVSAQQSDWDYAQLRHSGLYSVQLQPPGTVAPAAAPPSTPPPGA